ncbi:hypothetical protein GP486_003344 [Trichoglossum hirsutum]|uniref:CCAAT-binding factor domain-containing protein n=1 Tax=Trichoglossum hirsutum TaxID=265104 RepID=A0A9P8LD32_9PEZI|nr:hypothetical protein GP486_003344 [Trichoglossum hirsutum]
MVKRNHVPPSEKGNKTALTNGSVALPSTPLDLPSFDEHALSNLTRRIENRLRKSKEELHLGSKEGSLQGAAIGSGPRHAVKERAIEDKSKKRGKKRNRQGDVKSNEHNEHQGGGDNPKERRTGKGGPKSPRDKKPELLQEILLLGGTKEDLQLVAGVSSGSEVEAPAQSNGRGYGSKPGKTLQRDVEDFVRDLGITGKALTEEDSLDADLDGEECSVADKSPDGEPTTSSLTQRNLHKGKLQSAPNSSSGQDTAKMVGSQYDLIFLLADFVKIFEPRPDWHAAELPDLPSHIPDQPLPSRELLERVHRYATSLLEADNKLYSSARLLSTSSHRFLSTIMSSGTLSDKISALTLVVQESPVHTMKALENLLNLAKKRSRGQAVTALGAIKDLMAQGVVLPPDRKLKPFTKQPGLLGVFQQKQACHWKPGDPLPKQIQEVHLVSWAYEDWLKSFYFEMLRVLETWCSDEVEFARGRAVGYVWELLKEKPEQESNLLRLLVNKLGDPSRKIASKASFLLLQLQMTHPLMKSIIISSMESEVLFRPGQNSHAKYYAIITLNQTILSSREENVSNKLIEIYFGLFVFLLKQTDPAKRPDDPEANKKGQLQGGGGNLGKKAQQKADHAGEANKSEGELAEKLVSAVLTGVNRALPYSRTDDSTFEDHLDTLFRITHSSNFNTSIQALMLIQQLSTTKQTSSDRFYRTLYESLFDPRLLTSSKQAMYLNLLFKSLKADLNVKRVKAFVKRLLQVAALHQPSFICGVLYLVRELEGNFPALGAFLDQPEELSEDDEERFVDAPEGRVEDQYPEGLKRQAPDNVGRSNGHSLSSRYDGRKRDPGHSNADKSCLWELEPLLAHFHPSVALFATRLLRHEVMPSKPDLSLHTLIHFLDRFVYRNAKSNSAAPRGISIMQPLGSGDSSGVLLSARGISRGLAPLNSEAFWKKGIETVAADEVFFHKYFNQVGKAKAAGREKGKHRDKESPVGNARTDGNEDEIWRALVDSRPELEGSDEGDSGFEVEDFGEDDELDAMGESGYSSEGQSTYEHDEDADEDTGLDLRSDDDALIGSDEDIPSNLGAIFEKEVRTNQKEGLADNDIVRPQKRKKLRHLPTFASVDDYAEMLADEDE